MAVVLVHLYTILSGVHMACCGGTRRRAAGIHRRHLRHTRRSTGRASVTGSTEAGDVVAVCRCVAENIRPRDILLVGSSSGRFQSFASPQGGNLVAIRTFPVHGIVKPSRRQTAVVICQIDQTASLF